MCLIFSDEGRLAWMYKDKVDNEEFLLGRRIDDSALKDTEPAAESKCHQVFHTQAAWLADIQWQILSSSLFLYLLSLSLEVGP